MPYWITIKRIYGHFFSFPFETDLIKISWIKYNLLDISSSHFLFLLHFHLFYSTIFILYLIFSHLTFIPFLILIGLLLLIGQSQNLPVKKPQSYMIWYLKSIPKPCIHPF